MSTDRYSQIVFSIVGAAYDVQHELRGGLSEAIYEEALCRELRSRGLLVAPQQELTIFYKGEPLDKKYRVDILCEEDIVIELKAVEQILSEHRAQLFNYLRVTAMPIGILINFAMNGVHIERYCYDFDTNEVNYYNPPRRISEIDTFE